jgi:hypothetical protein
MAVKSGGRSISLVRPSLDESVCFWYEFDRNVMEYHYLPVKTDFLNLNEEGSKRIRASHLSGLSEEAKDALRVALVDGNCSFRDLLTSGRFTSDEIFMAIAEGVVYVGLATEVVGGTGVGAPHVSSDHE